MLIILVFKKEAIKQTTNPPDSLLTFKFPFFSFNMIEYFSSKRKHYAETKLDPFYKDWTHLRIKS